MLSSTKVFQSPFVAAGCSMNALSSQIPVRWASFKIDHMKFMFLIIAFILTNYCFAQSDISKTTFIKSNYRLEYPSTWRLDTSRISGTELFVFSPLENDNDKFRENVNVIIQNLSGQNIDLEKYKQITDDQLKRMANDCQVFESVITKTNKNEYYTATYTMTQGKFRLKITSLCYIKNDKAYLITFTSELDKYDQYKKVGNDILQSFVLTK